MYLIEFSGVIIYPEAKIFLSKFNFSNALLENPVAHDQREGESTWTDLVTREDPYTGAYKMRAPRHTQQSKEE